MFSLYCIYDGLFVLSLPCQILFCILTFLPFCCIQILYAIKKRKKEWHVIRYYLHVYDSALRIYRQTISEYRTANYLYCGHFQLVWNPPVNPQKKKKKKSKEKDVIRLRRAPASVGIRLKKGVCFKTIKLFKSVQAVHSFFFFFFNKRCKMNYYCDIIKC